MQITRKTLSKAQKRISDRAKQRITELSIIPTATLPQQSMQIKEDLCL